MPLSKSALWRKEVRDVYAEGGYTLGEAAKQAARRRKVGQQPVQVRSQAQVRQQSVQVRSQVQVRQQPVQFSSQVQVRQQPVQVRQQPASLIPIRQQPQPTLRVKAPRKPKVYRPITIQEARAAFDAYYTAENRTRPSKKNPEGRLRFNNAERSKAYDTNYTNSRVISDERYLRNPRKYDFLGVDTGPKIRKNRKN